MVPVFASGFADLQKRVEHQNHQTRANQAKLDELRTELERIDQRLQLETNGRLVKCQREHVKLAQKVLRVMGMVQLLRSHGHTNLTREEEELRARFEKLLKQMHAPEFRGYVDEMATQGML